MDVNVTGAVSSVNGYQSYQTKKSDVNETKREEQAAVYEKSADTKKATYSVAKMSEKDRAVLVSQLKSEQADRQQQLVSIVNDMMLKQAGAQDNVWKFIASGKFDVDAETKALAEQDISEDGYYGVKQTSERLFDFAMALAGDDVEKMKEMQAAVEKGFKLATKAWGRDLPEISHQTLDATNKLFEEYYASK